MTRGDSGRIVLEIDPATKLHLYEVLDAQGLTLKEWFLAQVRHYLRTVSQPDLLEGLEVDDGGTTVEPLERA